MHVCGYCVSPKMQELFLWLIGMHYNDLLFFRNRDIIDEENPYDAVTIEEEVKIYDDLVSYQKVPVRCTTSHYLFLS